jgi:GrpB-like predicted nucleotidyltransferase (UPF0157 family)
VPFPDESFAHTVEVVPYKPEWAVEGAELAGLIRRLVPTATATDHIGSTSVPGMPAKDCLDVMVRVRHLFDVDLGPLATAGYRERPEEWNQAETLDGTRYPKKVFAPPAGARAVNIHIREARCETARYALLFRDFLRADSNSRNTWASFKLRMAEANADIYAYGQVKTAVQPLLMDLAERWAAENSWKP